MRTPNIPTRYRLIFPGLAYLLLSAALHVNAKQWTVKPGSTYPTPKSLATLPASGDTIWIEAAVYTDHPQVQFTQDRLLIRGIHGRPRLEAGTALSTNTNGKAIFVISGKNCIIENIEFANASVPDHNGAGIRQEGCHLTVRYCFFNGNEMGVLGGSYSGCNVLLEHNVFANNGSTANPGFQHNIYINHIDTFIFRYNYSINAIAEGHELKSRARNTIILCNYIANLTTQDSRNVDIPNGGLAILSGNILEQGQNSVNSNIVGYGLEGFTNPGPHNVFVVNNSFINKKTTGSFIQVQSGTDTLYVKNNAFVGARTGGLIIGSPGRLDSSYNFVNTSMAAAGFVNSAGFNYHLQSGSPLIDRGTKSVRTVSGYALLPDKEYRDTAGFTKRPTDNAQDIGAFEFARSGRINRVNPLNGTIFPNPSSGGAVFTDLPERSPYTLTDALGQFRGSGLVLQGLVHLNGLNPGIYYLNTPNGSFRLIIAP